ncbi:MAG TPA: hypothetical protein VLD58_01055 [Gemmatimonadales bacterium]|nr:hypothetical protein [Gemmatimonadales bacterium]
MAALLWLAIGAGGLVLVAPQLAAGNIFDPRVFALTHVITLGVITTAISGALYQLFPVAMGRAVRNLRVAHLTFWLLQAGIVLLVTGFWVTSGHLQGCGWVAISLSVALFGVNLISRSLNTQPDQLIGWYVGAGYLALVAALGLGALRVGETLGYWHVDRLVMIASHFHLAGVGFATLVAIGVGHRMLPMFLVSHGFPRWPFRWSGVLAALGLVAFVTGKYAALGLLVRAGGLTIAAAGCIYAYLAEEYFRRRMRRALDPGLAHAAVAHLFLVAGILTGLRLLFEPSDFAPQLWAAYAVLLLLGWLVLLIVGVLYKILPFLTWLHIFGPRMGEAELPTVADLTRPAWGWVSLGCLAAGLSLLAPAIALGSGAVARLGALGVALGVALVLAQGARVLSMRYAR